MRVSFQNGECFFGSVENRSGANPEVFGHCEKDGRMIAGTAGWWRTADLVEAAKRAAMARNTQVVEQ